MPPPRGYWLNAAAFHFRPRIFEQRHHALALALRGNLQAARLGQRGIDVHVLYQRARCASGVLLARQRQNHGNVRIDFEVGVLAPGAVVAQLPAVVAPQNHCRVLTQAQPVEFPEHAPHLGVHVAHAGVVAVDQHAHGGRFHRTAGGNPRVSAQFAPVRARQLRHVLGPLAPRWQLDVLGRVEVPILLRRVERQMRLQESGRQKERLVPQPAQLLDGLVAGHAVRIRVIGHVGPLVSRTPAQLRRRRFLPGLHGPLMRRSKHRVVLAHRDH